MTKIDATGAFSDRDASRWRSRLGSFFTASATIDGAFVDRVIPSRTFVYAGLGAVLLLKLIALYAAVPLADEGYYWLWGQNLDWSYYDHPPLGGWALGLSSAILGDSLWAVRSTTVPVTLGLAWIIWFWIRELVEPARRTDTFLTALLLFGATPLMLIYTSVLFHDYLLIGTGVAAAHFFALYIRSLDTPKTRNVHLYAACFFVGLAGLSKYSGVFIGLGFAGWVFLSAQGRTLLRNPHLWLAGGLAAAMQFPTIYWNMIHDWPSFQYNLNDRIGDSRFTNPLSGFADFVGKFIFSVSPILCFALARYLIADHPVSSIAAFQKPGRFVFIASTLVFSVLSFSTIVLHYWNMTAVLFFVAVAFFFIKSATEVRLHTIWAIAYCSSLLVSAAVAPVGFDESAGKIHVYRISHGLPEIVAALETEEERLGADMVLTTDYRTASLLALTAKRPDIASIGHRSDMFDFWFDREAATGKDAIILAYKLYPLDKQLAGEFSRVSKIRDLSIERMGGVVQTYQIYHAEGFQPATEN